MQIDDNTLAVRRLFSPRSDNQDWLDLLTPGHVLRLPRGPKKDSITELSSLLEERGGEQFLWRRIRTKGDDKDMWEQIYPLSSTLGERILRDESYFEWLRKGKPQSDASEADVQAQLRKQGQSQSEKGQTKEKERVLLKEEGRRRDKFKKLLPWRKKV